MSSAITIAAVGAGLSAYGASQAGKAADRATSAQERAQQADLAFRQQQYDRYLGLMGPIEEQLAKEAKSSQPLGYDKASAQIKQEYANALRGITSSMGMRGLAGSGLDAGAIRAAGLMLPGNLSSAYQAGLDARRNLGLTLTGRGQIGQAAQGVSGGMQNLANFYGGQAGMWNQAAQQGWQNMGQNLQGLAGALGQANWNYGPPPTTTPQTTFNPTPIQPISPYTPDLTPATGPTPGVNLSGPWG